jgi:hypothetical protein
LKSGKPPNWVLPIGVPGTQFVAAAPQKVFESVRSMYR